MLGANPSSTSNYALIDGKNTETGPEMSYVLLVYKKGGKKRYYLQLCFDSPENAI